MIEFRNVSQSYKDHKVLTDINMTIQSGEFVVLIGSSGCGKTTLLKTINKLTSLAGGDLLIDGVSIRDIPDIALRRRIGYVIQDGGLFRGCAWFRQGVYGGEGGETGLRRRRPGAPH